MTKRSALKAIIWTAAAAAFILSASAVLADSAQDEGAAAEPSAVTETTVDNGIPVVYLDIDESDGNPTIDEMNKSVDHSVTCVFCRPYSCSECTCREESEYTHR